MKSGRVALSLLVLGVLFVSLPAEAQAAGRVYRIGLLSSFSAPETAFWYEAFRRGLRDLGWVEGKNITIEYRHTEGRSDRLPALAADLVGLNVEVIVTTIGADALAAKNATREIPIVMASPGDPLAAGLVESLARPGSNITGLSQIAPEMAAKRLELLKEIVPKLASVAVIWNPKGTTSRLSWSELQLPARELGVQLKSLEVRSASDLAGALEDAHGARVGALAVMPDPLFAANLKRIADLAVNNGLPSIFHLREFTDVGGLVAYGPDRSDMFRRAATFVDKILKGAKPGDLPIEQPTKFELVINLKTAKALGLTIPPSLLLRANQVIE